MIEQCIYGRADNRHTNGNGQVVEVGYGTLACSQRYDDVREYGEKYISAYRSSLFDAFKRYPTIMNMFGIDTPNGRIHVLQTNSYISTTSRDTHIAHQYVSTDDNGTDAIIRQPLSWMQLPFQTTQREPIEYQVLQTAELKPYVRFDPGSLEEVLRYFGMTPAAFKAILRSLFLVSGDEKSIVIILFDDGRPDYPEWIKRFVVHLYSFLPFSARRWFGFESWFAGDLMSGNIKLAFTSFRNFVTVSGQFYVKLDNEGNGLFSTEDCILFSGVNMSVQRESYKTALTSQDTSYMNFVAKWVDAACSMGDKCAQIESGLNWYWSVFDANENNKKALSMDDFSSLVKFELFKCGKGTITHQTALDDAYELCANIGDEGAAAFAAVLAEDARTSPAADKIDIYIDLLDSSVYGVASAKCAADLLRDSLKTMSLPTSKVRFLMSLESSGSIEHMDTVTEIALIANAVSCDDVWSDEDNLLNIAKADVLDSAEAYAKLESKVREFFPAEFVPDEKTNAVLKTALGLKHETIRSGFAALYVGRAVSDIKWLNAWIPKIMEFRSEALGVEVLCREAFNRGTLRTKNLEIPDATESLDLICLLFDMPGCEETCANIIGRAGSVNGNADEISAFADKIDKLAKEYQMGSRIQSATATYLLNAKGITDIERIEICAKRIEMFESETVLAGYIDTLAYVAETDRLIGILRDGSARDSVKEAILELICRTIEHDLKLPGNAGETLECLRGVILQSVLDDARIGRLMTALMSAIEMGIVKNADSAKNILSICTSPNISGTLSMPVIKRTIDSLPAIGDFGTVIELIGMMRLSERQDYCELLYARIAAEIGTMRISADTAVRLIDEYLRTSGYQKAAFINAVIGNALPGDAKEGEKYARLCGNIGKSLPEETLACVRLDDFARLISSMNANEYVLSDLYGTLGRAGAHTVSTFRGTLFSLLVDSDIPFLKKIALFGENAGNAGYTMDNLVTAILKKTDSVSLLNEIRVWYAKCGMMLPEAEAYINTKVREVVNAMSCAEILSALEAGCDEGMSRCMEERLMNAELLSGYGKTADDYAVCGIRIKALPLSHADTEELLLRLIGFARTAICCDKVKTISMLLGLASEWERVSERWTGDLGSCLCALLSRGETMEVEQIKANYLSWVSLMKKNGLELKSAFSFALFREMRAAGVDDFKDAAVYFAEVLNDPSCEAQLRVVVRELYLNTMISRAVRSKGKGKLDFGRWIQLAKDLNDKQEIIRLYAYCTCMVESKYPGTVADFMKGWLQEKDKKKEDICLLCGEFVRDADEFDQKVADAVKDAVSEALIVKLGDKLFSFDVMHDMLTTCAANCGTDVKYATVWLGWIIEKIRQKIKDPYVQALLKANAIRDGFVEAVAKANESEAFLKYVNWRLDRLKANMLKLGQDDLPRLMNMMNIGSPSELLNGWCNLLDHNKQLCEKRLLNDIGDICDRYCKACANSKPPAFPLWFDSEFEELPWDGAKTEVRTAVVCLSKLMSYVDDGRKRYMDLYKTILTPDEQETLKDRFSSIKAIQGSYKG